MRRTLKVLDVDLKQPQPEHWRELIAEREDINIVGFSTSACGGRTARGKLGLQRQHPCAVGGERLGDASATNWVQWMGGGGQWNSPAVYLGTVPHYPV